MLCGLGNVAGACGDPARSWRCRHECLALHDALPGPVFFAAPFVGLAALLPPAVVHSGQAPDVLAKRQTTLDAAYAAHPECFPHGRPQVGQLPRQVGINLPRPITVDERTTATSWAQSAATPASRVSAAQRPLDAGGAVGQAAPEVLAVEVTNASHFA